MKKKNIIEYPTCSCGHLISDHILICSHTFCNCGLGRYEAKARTFIVRRFFWWKWVTPVTNKLENSEDYGYTDHMVGQEAAPFYCGTAFCSHSTKAAARACWKNKCDAVDEIRKQADNARKKGNFDEAYRLEVIEMSKYYPEMRLK